MMIAMRPLRIILLLLPMLMLAACNAVGEGNKIESLQIKDAIVGNDVGQTLQTYQCLRYNLAALGTFTDGSSAFYTSRAIWSSSDTNVVRVSNGDITLPSNSASAYSRGTVIPVAPGTATVTVNYVGIKASVQITVLAPTSLQIVGVTPRDTRPSGNITIAPRTVQTFAAIATLGGRTTDITSAGSWSLDAPDATVASFVAGSVSSFQGVAPGGPFTVKADFNSIGGISSCPLALATTPQLSVAVLQSIALSSEFGASPDPLFVGTTDRLKAIATLNGGAQQDISELGITGDGTTDVTVYNVPLLNSSTATPPATPATNGSDYSTVLAYNNLLRSLLSAVSTDATPATPSDANTAQLTAKFITTPANTTTSTAEVNVTSNILKRTTQDGALASIEICAVAAANASGPISSCPQPAVSTTLKVPQFPQYGEDEAKLALKAIATFVMSDGSTKRQDVTRHVTWNSSNYGLISVINGSISPTQSGVAVGVQPGTATVNATWSKDGVNTVTSNTLSLTAQ